MRTVIVLALAAVTAFTSSKSNANDIFLQAFGNSFEMQIIQKNGSNNDLDLDVTGDYHVIDIVQDGNGNVADITIDGIYPTELNLYQDGNSFSYILNQYCTNSAGCVINVTQY